MENYPNRYRVSTKFTLLKIGIFIGLFSIVFNLVRDFSNDNFTSKSVIGLSLGGVGLLGALYYFSTRNRVDYDEIKQILYIVDSKSQTEIAIPV